MIEKIQKFREYLNYIEEHYKSVQKAWLLLQDKCMNMDFIANPEFFHQLDIAIKDHDASKLSVEEFTQYRQYFFPTTNEKKNKHLFFEAWEHHKINNDHHWQNWIQIENNTMKQKIALIHNIVDWVAMGFKSDDTARNYYEKNKQNINLPKWAESYMHKVFDCIYD